MVNNGSQWHHAAIRSQFAWSTSAGSTSVIVAVIDTGFDTSHPELASRLWTNTREIPNNGIDDDGNGVHCGIW
jgi:subtilisin family serine protease